MIKKIIRKLAFWSGVEDDIKELMAESMASDTFYLARYFTTMPDIMSVLFEYGKLIKNNKGKNIYASQADLVREIAEDSNMLGI